MNREITYEDVKEYCKPRCLTIIDNELLYELTHPKIKALEQEPIGDLISRQAVLDVWHTSYSNNREENEETQYKKIAFELPSVNPQEPKIGHWSRKTKVDAYDIAGVKTWGIKCQCDRCDFTTICVEDFGYYKYCPNCGSAMKEE